MRVEGGMKSVKFFVFFFNFIFWLYGIALIVLRILVQIELNDTLLITSVSASGAPIVFLIVGVVIFFITFFGCCGAWKENYCMVTMFAVLLTLIFLVEIAAAIAGYIFKNKVEDMLHKGIIMEMQQYNKSLDYKNAVDKLQTGYSCCGAANFTDWFQIPEFSKSVPQSCCLKNATDCTKNPMPANVYKQGCVSKIEGWMKNHIVIVAGVALGIAFFELLSIIFACCLMKGICSSYELM